MKAPKIETGMIRGYVVLGDRGVCCIEKGREGCIEAYTFWYRHDEDLERLEQELDRLVKAYSSMRYFSSCMIGYETKPYRG